MKKSYILLSLLLALACRNGHTSGSALDRDLLVKVYADVLIVREENGISRLDSAQGRVKLDSVYQAYHTSSSEVDSSIQSYKIDINRWREFYDDVARRIEDIQQKQRQQTSN
ncbi:MAG TPA: hypothetical protein VL633_08675 [Bacteroidota bacterium]|nr:hypothetical protein [Bacteroidota bacterium]